MDTVSSLTLTPASEPLPGSFSVPRLSIPATSYVCRKNGRQRPHRIRWSAELKEALLESQGRRCCLCGVRFANRSNFDCDSPTLEHILSLWWGGADHPENLVVTCYGCNTKRGKKLDEFSVYGTARGSEG